MDRAYAIKERRLSESSFRIIKEIILTHSGINLNNTKIELVKNRLRKRLKALKISSYREYCELLKCNTGEGEIPYLIDAISTNITSFFRERAHYRFLYDHALPAIYNEIYGKKTRIRIWSAACSSGEEPYSIAMIADAFFKDVHVDLKILATDICNDVIKVARKGYYHKNKLQNVPDYFKKYFKPYIEDYDKINDKIIDKVLFRKLNLNIEQYPFRNKFDIIFCRNVLIYFDNNVQKQLIDRFKNYLKPGGFLFLGHAESLNGKVEGFSYLAPAIYKRK